MFWLALAIGAGVFFLWVFTNLQDTARGLAAERRREKEQLKRTREELGLESELDAGLLLEGEYAEAGYADDYGYRPARLLFPSEQLDSVLNDLRASHLESRRKAVSERFGGLDLDDAEALIAKRLVTVSTKAIVTTDDVRKAVSREDLIQALNEMQDLKTRPRGDS